MSPVDGSPGGDWFADDQARSDHWRRRAQTAEAVNSDLLAALEDVRNQFLSDADDPYVGWRKRMRDAVDEAIAKARGDSP